MKDLSYSEKLKNPQWQKKRLQIFQRDNWTCQSCGDTTSPLHIHHLKYFRVDPWEYDDHFLVTYCETCHESEHHLGQSVRDSLIELVKADKIYIRPLGQLCVLIEDYPPFYSQLREFLNQNMINFLKTKAA